MKTPEIKKKNLQIKSTKLPSLAKAEREQAKARKQYRIAKR
jgi:hypothetical protein